jgi:hypothetical protein
MNDNKFKWLVSSVCLTAILITAIVVIVPKMFNSRHQTSEKSIGEYVYIDDNAILHTDRSCSRLNYKDMYSVRMKTALATKDDYDTFCPKCVSDKQYEKFQH